MIETSVHSVKSCELGQVQAHECESGNFLTRRLVVRSGAGDVMVLVLFADSSEDLMVHEVGVVYPDITPLQAGAPQ